MDKDRIKRFIQPADGVTVIKRGDGRPLVEEAPELTEDDEAILDKIWDKVAAEEEEKGAE